jgi:D-alanyl-D-alanine carboxypeptidase
MKKKLILALAALMALCAIFTACDSANGGEDLSGPYLVLVNKQNAAGENYVPENLTTLDAAYTAGGKTIQLENTVADAVVSMIEAMRAAGIDNVSVTSGYRTYEYQKTLFERYMAEEKEKHPSLSDEEIKQIVLTYSAYPGTSEHQTGLCVDLYTDEMVGLWNYGSETPDNPYDKGFAETDAFVWLCEHAHEYGFILRFPENKTDVTGYSYESWHYRYVGVEHAKKIHQEGITLEEYLGK